MTTLAEVACLFASIYLTFGISDLLKNTVCDWHDGKRGKWGQKIYCLFLLFRVLMIIGLITAYFKL